MQKNLAEGQCWPSVLNLYHDVQERRQILLQGDFSIYQPCERQARRDDTRAAILETYAGLQNTTNNLTREYPQIRKWEKYQEFYAVGYPLAALSIKSIEEKSATATALSHYGFFITLVDDMGENEMWKDKEQISYSAFQEVCTEIAALLQHETPEKSLTLTEKETKYKNLVLSVFTQFYDFVSQKDDFTKLKSFFDNYILLFLESVILHRRTRDKLQRSEANSSDLKKLQEIMPYDMSIGIIFLTTLLSRSDILNMTLIQDNLLNKLLHDVILAQCTGAMQNLIATSEREINNNEQNLAVIRAILNGSVSQAEATRSKRKEELPAYKQKLQPYLDAVQQEIMSNMTVLLNKNSYYNSKFSSEITDFFKNFVFGSVINLQALYQVTNNQI